MLWNEIEDTSGMLGVHRKMVFREEMQKVVLTSLALQGCFNDIVFQGGTALRFFHGNPRFSEDIDLVLDQPGTRRGMDDNKLTDVPAHVPADVLTDVLIRALPGIKQSVRDTFPFINEVGIRTQKNDRDLQRHILMTRSDNPEHTLRVHIELAAIPSYRNQPRILNFPPVNPAVRVEDIDEILADKMCALALRPYLKGRDLWDIHYLIHDRAVTVDWDLVLKKVGDYKAEVSEHGEVSDRGKVLTRGGVSEQGETSNHWEILTQGLDGAGEKIRTEGSSTLRNEMERFLPSNVLESYRSSFDSILETVIKVIREHDAVPGE